MAEENMLGTEGIGRLLMRFSVPTAMTLIVNSLYNMADQIFVGRAVGIDGVAATNVAFPLFLFAGALALLIGDGTAANISLSLGRREQERADGFFANGIALLIICCLLIVVGGTVFLKPLLRLFGATEAVLSVSCDYAGIVLLGFPFTMFNMAFTAIIRADGNPKYMMRTMMIGTALNLMLDPIFIFVFEWGVKGAAIATVISNIASGTMAISYIPKTEHVSAKIKAMRLRAEYALAIVKLGFSSFSTQMATAATQIVMNNCMRKYGAMSIYGSEITISCFGVMTKIYQIAHSMFVGLASGTQPINGYNFGAKKYERVKSAYKTAFAASLAVSLIWFLIFQLGSGVLAGLFIKDEPLYIEFARRCFHIYMLTFFIYGPPQITASFFQAVGRPSRALMVALARQIAFLIPLAVILSSLYGLDGALAAAPSADTLAFIFALIMVLSEFRAWKKKGLIS